MDKEIIGKILTENLWEFHQRVLQADNPDNKMGQIHQKLCRIMDDMQRHKRVMILLPRGHLKSSLVTVGWSIQQICKNPNVRILIGSETNAKAKDFLKQIRDTFEKNPRVRWLYGNHVRTQSRWTDDEITSALRTSTAVKEPTVFTTGTDQTRTGAHCDIAILDDPVSHTNINTKEAREKTLKWYREIANNILDPGGLLVVIGTRWHFADIYQYIYDELSDVFNIFHHQALTDDAYEVLRRDIPLLDKEKFITPDKILFSEKFTVQQLWEIYSGNSNEFFNNQYMNRIVDTENADFKEIDIQFYDPADRLPFLNTYMAIDPAISETGDYTAIICVGIDEKMNWYVLEYDNDRMKPDEIIRRTFEMYTRHSHTRKIGIETAAYQKSLVYGFKDEMKKRQKMLPLIELSRGGRNSMTKEQRILSLQPIVRQKRLYIQKGMIELREQLRTFPRSRYDDVLDALASLTDIIVGFKKQKGYTYTNETREEREDREAEIAHRRRVRNFFPSRRSITGY